MDGISTVTQPPSLGFSNIPMPKPPSEQPEYQRLQAQYQAEQAPITAEQKKYTDMVQGLNTEYEALKAKHPFKEQPTAPAAPTNKMGITEAMILGLTAALGSMGTRAPANNAMLALTSALNGYQKGNMAQFEQATKAFHEQAENIKSYNEDAIKQIEMGLKGKSLGLEAQKSVLDNLIAQHGATKDQLKTIEDTYTKGIEAVQKMTQTNASLVKMQNALRDGGRRHPSLTTIVDPKDPTRMITVDVNTYGGGGKEDPGFIGVAGKEPAAAKKEETMSAGIDLLEEQLGNLERSYGKLKEAGAIPSTEKGALQNIPAYLSTTGAGQVAGRMTGTQAQAERDVIKSARLQLLQGIKQATGMSAQQLNSNVELQSWLDAVTNPSATYEANMQILENIRDWVARRAKPAEKKKGGTLSPKLSSEDADAVDWAKSNPDDPRAQKILQMHGM